MKQQKEIMQNVYAKLISGIIQNIKKNRYAAAKFVNREILALYLQTGKMLLENIKTSDWGDKVVQTISEEIQNSLPGIRGFSVSNLKNMRQFYEAYSFLLMGQLSTGQSSSAEFSQLSTGQLSEQHIVRFPAAQLSVNEQKEFLKIFLHIGFTHHVLLLQKCRGLKERFFYMQEALRNQWSVPVLQYHVTSKLYKRKGRLSHNFTSTLPAQNRRHAIETFKDEYLLNFININEEDAERVLEEEIVRNIRDFLMSLGREFSFLGSQYRVVVDEEEFFIDLLFFHRSLQALIAIDLKTGKFKPEYAGKMNFYLAALDEYELTEEEFAYILTTFPLVPDPVRVAARNAYREVERGLIK